MILETCSDVTVSNRDLASISDAQASGLSLHGGPEARHEKSFDLRWRSAPESKRQLVRLHYDAYVRDGRQPFTWTIPGTARSFSVRYARPPQHTRDGRHAGAIAVELHEVFLTD